jgi:hypothetical protein
VLYATTRNEFDASLAAAEDYEPGIPNVTIRMWGLGADSLANTGDDLLLNEVQSDAWQHPGLNNPDNPEGCDVRDMDGNPFVSNITGIVSDNCVEVPMLGNETKPGAYDGGWAFGDVCETGGVLAGGDLDGDGIPNDRDPDALFDPETAACSGPITPDDYVIQVVGNEIVPQFPPPPCVGDLHTIPPTDFDGAPGFPTGEDRPLCDKRLVTLQPQQNAGLDIFLFTTDQPCLPFMDHSRIGASARSFLWSGGRQPHPQPQLRFDHLWRAPLCGKCTHRCLRLFRKASDHGFLG